VSLADFLCSLLCCFSLHKFLVYILLKYAMCSKCEFLWIFWNLVTPFVNFRNFSEICDYFRNLNKICDCLQEFE
jgi:hypothetical protein